MNTERIIKINDRQITIPREFFDALGFNTHIKLVVNDGKLIVEPLNVRDPLDFTELVRNELLKEGYSGDELNQKMKERLKELSLATEEIIREAYEELKSIGKPTGRDFMKSLFDEEG